MGARIGAGGGVRGNWDRAPSTSPDRESPAFLSPHALFQLLMLASDVHGKIKPERAQCLSETVCGDPALDLSLYILCMMGNSVAALRHWGDRCLASTAGRLSY